MSAVPCGQPTSLFLAFWHALVVISFKESSAHLKKANDVHNTNYFRNDTLLQSIFSLVSGETFKTTLVWFKIVWQTYRYTVCLRNPFKMTRKNPPKTKNKKPTNKKKKKKKRRKKNSIVHELFWQSFFLELLVIAKILVFETMIFIGNLEFRILKCTFHILYFESWMSLLGFRNTNRFY